MLPSCQLWRNGGDMQVHVSCQQRTKNYHSSSAGSNSFWLTKIWQYTEQYCSVSPVYREENVTWTDMFFSRLEQLPILVSSTVLQILLDLHIHREASFPVYFLFRYMEEWCEISSVLHKFSAGEKIFTAMSSQYFFCHAPILTTFLPIE